MQKCDFQIGFQRCKSVRILFLSNFVEFEKYCTIQIHVIIFLQNRSRYRTEWAFQRFSGLVGPKWPFQAASRRIANCGNGDILEKHWKRNFFAHSTWDNFSSRKPNWKAKRVKARPSCVRSARSSIHYLKDSRSHPRSRLSATILDNIGFVRAFSNEIISHRRM